MVLPAFIVKKRVRMAAAGAAAVFFILLILGRSTRPVSEVRRWVVRTLAPVGAAGTRVGGFMTGSNADEVLKEEEVRQRLAVAEAERSVLGQENESLRHLLGLKERAVASGIAADVLSYAHAMGTETLVIDAGSNRDIVVGDIVIDEHRLLVGQVSEINAETAVVSIASNSGSAFSGVLVPVGGKILIKGLGGRALALELIPYDTPLRDGDAVLWASESKRNAAAIFAGRVVKGSTASAGAFKTGRAVLLADPDALDRVFVINGR